MRCLENLEAGHEPIQMIRTFLALSSTASLWVRLVSQAKSLSNRRNVDRADQDLAASAVQKQAISGPSIAIPVNPTGVPTFLQS
jgi:hypothetical protein